MCLYYSPVPPCWKSVYSQKAGYHVLCTHLLSGEKTHEGKWLFRWMLKNDYYFNKLKKQGEIKVQVVGRYSGSQGRREEKKSAKEGQIIEGHNAHSKKAGLFFNEPLKSYGQQEKTLSLQENMQSISTNN